MRQAQPHVDLVDLNTARLILDTVGRETLEVIVSDYLESLGTSAAVYERNGDYAAGILSSGWCRFMDARSRQLSGTDDIREALASGRWHCHESCWTEASKPSIDRGEPVDTACRGGIRLYAVPIIARGEVVGSMNFGYGTPPRTEPELAEVAARYDVPVGRLLHLSREYQARSDDVVEAAKRLLRTTARLIGVLVERRFAEQERDQSQLFIGVLAHDLRNPLAAITMSADLILKRADDLPGWMAETATRILRSGNRAERMVGQLLDFARARFGGGLPIAPRRVDVAQVVARVVDELSVARPHRAIRLRGEARCEAEIDPDRYGEIVANLVTNADEHGAPETPIDVRLIAQPDAVRLEVRNQGPVIPAELISHIFEPMRRGDRAAGKGLGLGLFIVREIVAAHHGHVQVLSSESDGTIFAVTLPRLPTSPPTGTLGSQ